MLNKGSVLVLSCMIFLVILTSWYAASLTRLSVLPTGGTLNMGVLTQAHVVQMSDQGKVQYNGMAQNATEFNNGDIHFEGLNILYYTHDAGNGAAITPWTLKADTGVALKQNTEIDLQGNVNLSRPSTAKTPALLAQTEAARVYLQTNQIRGDDLISLSQPGSINQMQGVGFVVDIQGQWMKLLSAVKGTYAPDSSTN